MLLDKQIEVFNQKMYVPCFLEIKLPENQCIKNMCMRQ